MAQLMRRLTGILGCGLPEKTNLDLLVYKLKPINHYSDSWEWKIIEQCNGQSIQKIVETLYLDELRKGASLVDIGIWKTLFDRTVVATVYELAHNGYIRLLPSWESWKDAVPAEAKNKSGISEVWNAERQRTVDSAIHPTSVLTSSAKFSNELCRLPESVIWFKGALMEQVRRTVGTCPAPIGDKPGGSDRQEGRKRNWDSDPVVQRTREPHPEDNRRDSERSAPKNRAVTIVFGGSTQRFLSFAVVILRLLRRLGHAGIFAAIISGDMQRNRLGGNARELTGDQG